MDKNVKNFIYLNYIMLKGNNLGIRLKISGVDSFK